MIQLGRQCSLVFSVVVLSVCFSLVFAQPSQAQGLFGNKGQSGSASTFPIMPGDALQITFYDRYQKTENTTAPTFKRADLSGDYPVAGDGSITLPQLGIVPVEGMSLADLTGRLEKESAALGSNDLIVRVAFSNRPPVYIKGNIRNPGAYRYMPGLTIGKLVALASGYKLIASRDVSADVILDAQSNIPIYRTKLARLLAQKAQLEAEYRNKPSLGVPIEMTSLVGERMAADLIAEQQELHRIRGQLWRDRLALADQEIKLAQSGHASAKDALTLAQIRADLDAEKLEFWEKTYQPDYFKVSTKAREGRLRDEKVSLASARAAQDAETLLSDAKAKVVRAAQQIADLKLSHTTKLTSDLANVESLILDYRGLLAISESKLNNTLAQQKTASQNNQRAVSLIIQRLSKTGLTDIAADEQILLRPGDIVQVSLK